MTRLHEPSLAPLAALSGDGNTSTPSPSVPVSLHTSRSSPLQWFSSMPSTTERSVSSQDFRGHNNINLTISFPFSTFRAPQKLQVSLIYSLFTLQDQLQASSITSNGSASSIKFPFEKKLFVGWKLERKIKEIKIQFKIGSKLFDVLWNRGGTIRDVCLSRWECEMRSWINIRRIIKRRPWASILEVSSSAATCILAFKRQCHKQSTSKAILLIETFRLAFPVNVNRIDNKSEIEIDWLLSGRWSA